MAVCVAFFCLLVVGCPAKRVTNLVRQVVEHQGELHSFVDYADDVESASLHTHSGSAMDNLVQGVSKECGRLAKKFPNQVGATAIKKGSKAGRFLLAKCLGAGGLGEVWLAKYKEELFVIKFPTISSFMIPETKPIKEVAFETECTFAKKASMRVQSKSEIANCILEDSLEVSWSDWMDGDGTGYLPYAVFELVTGAELERVLKHSPIRTQPPLADLAGVFKVMNGIATIMEQLQAPVDGVKLFHDDIQPSNIMVTADGKVALLDYGFSFMCCENTVKQDMSERHYVKCDLDPSYGPGVAFCDHDRKTQKVLDGQTKFLVQNFLSMLIKFPEDSQFGLSPWWSAFMRLTGKEALDYVKTNMRDEYGEISQWTSECANVLSQALAFVNAVFSEESFTCDTQCFIDAIRRGLDSLK